MLMFVLLVVPVLSACLEAASLLAVGLMGLGYKCCVYLCSGVVPTAAPLGGIITIPYHGRKVHAKFWP